MIRENKIGLLKFLRLMAMVAGGFALLLCLLIILNFYHLQRIDPLNTAIIAALHEKLAADPANEAIRLEIRELDLLARKAFFTSQWQIRTGGYLLALSLLVVVISLKVAEMITPPVPVVAGEPGDPRHKRKKQQQWVTVAGILMIVATVAAAWMSHRMLAGDPVRLSPEPVAALSPDSAGDPAGNQEGDSPQPADTLAADSLPGDLSAGDDGYPSRQEVLDNFTTFRGPGGNGVAWQKNIPVSWNGATGKNIRWKTALPLPGYNSPVLWKGRIFLSGAKEKRKEIYCIDAATGAIQWTADVSAIPGTPGAVPKVIAETGLAAPTLTTDGRRVYAIFANGDLAAVDMTGKLVWSMNLGFPKNHYGHSSSLIMYRDLLIVQYDQSGSARVIAFRGKNGEKVWETIRSVKISWASPVIVNTGTRTELLLAAEPAVISYDPATGKELWSLDCISGEVGPSLTYGSGLVFSVNEYSKLAAVRPGSPATQVWEDSEYLSDVPSPVAFNDLLFVVTSYGAVVCYDAAGGTKHWVKELDQGVYASPMVADGKLFVMDKQGSMHMFAATKALQEIGTASLGEGSVCTPAFGDGRIYQRGNKHLFCIE